MSSKRSLLGAAAAAGLSLVLAGCGGGGEGGAGSAALTGSNIVSDAGNGGRDGNVPQANANSFLGRIRALIADTSETSEPVDIKSITLTMPEDGEPMPVS